MVIGVFRVYSNSGAFENSTTNQRAFQGHQNQYKNLPVNYQEYQQTPSYLRQYETQEKQTYKD
jgi:hypothetical protein